MIKLKFLTLLTLLLLTFNANAAFDAVKSDGSVVTWGDAYRGGDSRKVAFDLVS